ncbi:MAG: DUF1828 domain-containing protein [Acidobacteriota bacterium]
MTPCEKIARTVNELFICSPVKGYQQIRTPFLYPDGDIIDLYLATNGQDVTLTDLGETMRWLRSQTLSPRRSIKQNQLVEDICLNHGIGFYRGMLSLRVHEQDNMAQVVTRLAQAAIRVADLSFTFRQRTAETVSDEVAELLHERALPFYRPEQLPGRSGKVWRIDFHVRAPQRSSLVNVLSTASKGTVRGIVDHTVAGWFDLSHLKIGPEGNKFVSLFDDTVDVWTHEDIELVSELSEVAYWSRPDQFIEMLAAAA